jgi:phage-related protein
MTSAVNVFYTEGRNLFIDKMDAVINNVIQIIARALAEAKAAVASGKKEVQAYVEKLPADLRKVGDQAANDVQEKFDQLESSIDSKQNELVEKLASKYNEKLQAVDARIEELKAANQGLVDKAINAVVGAIKAILKLKDLLLNVLAKIIDVVVGIIKDPIGFLGNLIDGVKLGLNNFISALPKHLVNALVAWLTGELGPMGIKIPDDIFSLEGIFSLVMQILGLTWDAIRAKAVKLLGEPVVKALETGFEIFKILINEGPIGLWKYVKEVVGNLKDMVIDDHRYDQDRGDPGRDQSGSWGC